LEKYFSFPSGSQNMKHSLRAISFFLILIYSVQIFASFKSREEGVFNDRIAFVTGSVAVISYLASLITAGIIFDESENHQAEIWETRKIAAASWGTQLGSLVVALGLGFAEKDLESGVVAASGTVIAYILSWVADVMVFSDWKRARAFSEGLVRASIANIVFTVGGVIGTALGVSIWRYARAPGEMV
jgi:hypothetical protein